MKIISRDEAISQGLKYYFTGKPCKRGHVASILVSTGQCCECNSERAKDYYNKNKDKITEQRKDYRKQNKNKISEGMKGYYKQNKDKLSKRKKNYYKQNKDKINEQSKNYYNENKDTITEKKKEYYNENKDMILVQKKEYHKQNPAPKFLRDSLNRIFNNWKGGRKKMEKLHGYTFEQLVARIEFQFKDGMSWDNRSEWHIDHKKPIARFLEQGITDPKIINALSNLQPLWAKDNLSKSNKWEK